MILIFQYRIRQMFKKFELTVDCDSLMKKLNLDSKDQLGYQDLNAMFAKNYFA
jgi:hypothetical protein